MKVEVAGKFKVYNGVRIDLSEDLGKYYSKLVYFKYKIITSTPMYGVHVTVINPKFEKEYGYTKGWKDFKYLNGMSVNVSFDNEDIRIGGWKSGFLNFWVECKVRFAHKEMFLNDRKDLHCVFCSTKFTKGGSPKEYNGLKVIDKKLSINGNEFYKKEI